MVPSYLRPGHHPSREGSTAAAVAYLARSPAAQAAAARAVVAAGAGAGAIDDSDSSESALQEGNRHRG
jgi:hypothetical protein